MDYPVYMHEGKAYAAAPFVAKLGLMCRPCAMWNDHHASRCPKYEGEFANRTHALVCFKTWESRRVFIEPDQLDEYMAKAVASRLES